MKTFSGKPQMLKEVNSSMIEQLIFENGPLSKPELAKLTGLSLPTINKLVDDLEKHDQLCSVGQTGKGAGRKAVLYETNRNSGCLLVCYYKEESFLCRLTDMLNETLYEKNFALDSSNLKNANNSIINAIDTLIIQAPSKVKIIGIGLPGVVQPSGCLLAIPQIAVWEGLNLERILHNRYKTTIYVENNAKLSAVGYYFTHLRKKQDNLVYMYVGNGIGSGIILNKQLHRGSGNFSGEIGFITEPFVSRELDYIASGGYMESLMFPLVDYSTGELRKIDLQKQENLIAILCSIAVNHVVIVNPGTIVFAGKIFNKNLIETIRRQMMHYLPAQAMPRITRDLSTTTGLEGLIRSCREYITTRVHLVQSTGLPHRTDKIAV